MKILNHVFELKFRGRNKFTHFKVHKYPYYRHLCWWKVSFIFGQPHLEPVRVCSDCLEEISVLNAGDEYWDYCYGCQQTEGRTHEITLEEYESR